MSLAELIALAVQLGVPELVQLGEAIASEIAHRSEKAELQAAASAIDVASNAAELAKFGTPKS